MVDNSKFEAGIEKFRKVMHEKAEQRARKVVFAFFQELSLETPVRQGILRENWEIADGAPAGSFNSERKYSWGGAVHRCFAVLESSRVVGKLWYITNRTPYARRIDNGYSIQKPAGMTRPALRRLRRWIKAKLI